jgi:hypothetical protein
MSKFNEVKINKSFVEVFEVEQESFITIIDGWRIRIYFDAKLQGAIRGGQFIEVEHEGELSKPHSIKFKKLK